MDKNIFINKDKLERAEAVVYGKRAFTEESVEKTALNIVLQGDDKIEPKSDEAVLGVYKIIGGGFNDDKKPEVREPIEVDEKSGDALIDDTKSGEELEVVGQKKKPKK